MSAQPLSFILLWNWLWQKKPMPRIGLAIKLQTAWTACRKVLPTPQDNRLLLRLVQTLIDSIWILSHLTHFCGKIPPSCLGFWHQRAYWVSSAFRSQREFTWPHRRISCRHIIDMDWLYRSPIPVGGAGYFTISNDFYLPSRHLEGGGESQHHKIIKRKNGK